MEYFKIWNRGKHLLLGLAFLVCAFLVAGITEVAWYNMVVKIREAITGGDTGLLILASASNNIISMIQNALVSIGIILIISEWKLYNKNVLKVIAIIIGFVSVNIFIAKMTLFPWEPVTNVVSLIIIIVLVRQFEEKFDALYRWMILSMIVFFAFQWLNIMPDLTKYNFGTTDISYSIKMASIYLDSTQVLNFIGLAFFIPLFFTALITTGLFMSNDQNIVMLNENFENQKALDEIRSKVLENRIYEEIHSLTHDLKTPLVTIRGLSSLLSMSKDVDKIEAYTGRIDGAVEKMTEMITSFLYESSRQNLTVTEISAYVRAQIPIEDDTLEVIVNQSEDLPMVKVNKIRVVRALINIIENAIVVETKEDHKIIKIEFLGDEKELVIRVSDNGTGISKESLSKIWEMGYSTNNTSGMGLAFAKKVIEDHKGSVTIESEVGIGTRVSIVLPSSEYVDYGEDM